MKVQKDKQRRNVQEKYFVLLLHYANIGGTVLLTRFCVVL